MKRENLAQWYRQMAVLTRCGIPATRALEACANQTSDRRLRAATSILLAELRVGQRLSQAMRTTGSPFSGLQVGAVEVGERQGDLALVFERLAEHAEESARLRRRLQAALAYPVLVVSFSLTCLYLLVRFLGPVLGEVSQQLGKPPEGLSWLLVRLGELFASESLMLAGALFLAVLGRALFRHGWTHHRRRLEHALLRLPLLGKMARLAILIRISATMELMIGAGLPLTEAMLLAGRGCGSQEYAEGVLGPAVERVQRGESLRDSLRGSSGLPASFSGLVLAGEQSGRLEESFGHLARLFELELVSALETFLAALEPLSIALVGSVVLGVLLVVFVPLTQLVTVV